MSELREISLRGDSKLMWDVDNEAEVAAARNLFDELKSKGYTAFSVAKGGEENQIIDEFDPDGEKIIMVPPIRGG